MMIVKNYVAPSKIHGVGLFAGENVEKDQIIYVLTPGIDLVMTPDAIEKFGEEFSRFMGVYAYRDIKSGEITISLDNARFMNHHNHPNTLWTYIFGWAARDIGRRGIDLRLQ
jgi:SET domain-containing protein